MSNTRKYVPLIVKLEAIKRLEKGETIEKLAAEYEVGEVTVGVWRINKDKIQRQYLSNKCSGIRPYKRKSSTMKYEYEQTSRALFYWFTQQRQKGNPISWHILRKKALYFRNKLMDGEDDFTAGSRWLEKWMKRYSIDITGGNSKNGSKETEKEDTAASTSQSGIEVSNLSSVNETGGGISESQSDDDSNHSADLLPLQDELLQDSTSQHAEFLSETPSSPNCDPLTLPSTSSYVPETEIPTPSHTISSTAQSNSVTQSLSQQTNRGAKRHLEDFDMSPVLGNKQRKADNAIPQENGINAALDRLEDLSDKASLLGAKDDDLDSFGKYVASLLRSFPTERATELQKEVVNLILNSHVKDKPDSSEVPPLCTNSAPPPSVSEEQLPPQSSLHSSGKCLTVQSTTVRRKNHEECTSTSQRLVPVQEKSRTTNGHQNNGVNERSSGRLASSAQSTSSTLLQQSIASEMRLLCDVESPENDPLECDDAVLETKRVDAALKRLECISEKVNLLSERDDNFDTFGKYVASLLRYVPTEKAVGLQQEVINLILKSRANTVT